MTIKKENNNKEIIIDASGESLGRLASKVAVFLQGKTNANFDPSKDNIQKVQINNLQKIVFKGNKLNTKKYYSHSGYIGHLKEIKLKDLWQKNPVLVFKKAVLGMLPKNKLRAKRIKRLEIKI